jgi:hypothetical protein
MTCVIRHCYGYRISIHCRESFRCGNFHRDCFRRDFVQRYCYHLFASLHRYFDPFHRNFRRGDRRLNSWP